MTLTNQPWNQPWDITNAPAANIKQGLLFALESYSPTQKAAIKKVLKNIYDGIYSKKPAVPFYTIGIDDTQGLSDYLDNLLPIFSGGEPHRKYVKHKLLAFIENGKRVATERGGMPIDRILFFYNKELHGIGMHPDFGDAINAANNIDMRSEEGNGGIEDQINFPWGIDDPYSWSFALVNATEDLIKKRPNAIVITIKAWPRKKFEFLMNQYFHPGIAAYAPETVETVWDATDEEVQTKFSRPDYD